MKIAKLRDFGPPEVLHVEDAPQPVPGANELLIQVHAASVSFADRTVDAHRYADAKTRTGSVVLSLVP